MTRTVFAALLLCGAAADPKDGETPAHLQERCHRHVIVRVLEEMGQG
jgi:hypothetical protein